MTTNGKSKATPMVSFSRKEAEVSELPLSKVVHELSIQKIIYFQGMLDETKEEATTGNSDEIQQNLASADYSLETTNQSLQNLKNSISGRAVVPNVTRPFIGHGTLAKVFRGSNPQLFLFENEPPPLQVADHLGIFIVSMTTPVGEGLKQKKVNDEVTVNNIKYTVAQIFTSAELENLVFPKPELASA
jgi:hypothetical protein